MPRIAAPSLPAQIIATSQQSRFHSETLDVPEVDLAGLNLAIGDKELLVDAKLKCKTGVRYALVGRNGTGKSTLFQAMADKLIPGLAPSLRILLVSQVQDAERVSEVGTSVSNHTVLDHVVTGDKERTKAVSDFEALTRAVQSTDVKQTQRIVNEIRVRTRLEELDNARKVASRRSGARGKAARTEELAAEERLRAAEEKLKCGQVEIDVVGRATEMLSDVQTTLELLDSTTTVARAGSILAGLGFSLDMIKSPYASLSGGWRSRCALATALLVDSDVLLIDEASNFLDLEATVWLERFLIDQSRTVVLTSHDQVFLNNVVEETIVMRNNSLVYFEGTPHAMEVAERKERLGKEKQQRALDKKKGHIEASIQKGRESAKQSGDDNRLRMAKSRQRKLDERWGNERSASGGRFKLNRDLAGYHFTNRAEIEIESKEAAVRLRIHDPPSLKTVGDLIHFDNVAFRYKGKKEYMLSGVSFTVDQGGRCAFVGANGNGKSTLARLIVGDLLPSKGTIVRHPSLTIGYYSQHSVEQLSNDLSLTSLCFFLQHFTARSIDVTEPEARSCLGSFGLGGKLASDTPIGSLSGGQKVRLALSLLLFKPPGLLVLDEVTTHVDAPTIKALGQALKHYSGGIILITHDRWFSKVVIERKKPFMSDEESSSSSSSSEDDGAPAIGKTYHVAKGTIKKLPDGMEQYERLVERRLGRK